MRRKFSRLIQVVVVSSLTIGLLSGASRLSVAAAQNVTSAILSGRIEDSNGDALGGVSITLINRDTNRRWSAVSDGSGRVFVSFLPPGSYRFLAERQAFQSYERNLTLTVGQMIDLAIRLTVAGAAETVQVTSDVPLIEVARTQVADTVEPREIDNLPLNGRNYLDLALLVPSVSRTNTGSNQRFAETSAVPGTGISVAGQRNLNNSFIVDGLSANDDAAALAGAFFSQEVIREFQVVTSGGVAEFGRASGGVVNVVTQSGSNQWRGRGYGFWRDDSLDARNPLAGAKDRLSQWQYGASIGGPISTDRTFLFSNFEQTRQDRTGFITIGNANVAAINNELARAGFRGPQIKTGGFAITQDSTNYFARIDHELNPSNRLSFRYYLYDVSSQNARNVGGLNSVSRGAGLANRDQTIALNALSSFSSRVVNEGRAQYTRSRLQAPVNDLIGPAINISGTASFGTATFSPTARSNDLYEVVDSLSISRGPHSLKLGGDFLFNRLNITFPSALQGVYTFANLDAFRQGRYINFQQVFGEPDQFQSNPNVGLFVQNEWRPRSDLTINAGLRYEAQWLADPVTTDLNNLAPRLGIAFAPGEHKTVIRAGGGLYYDRIPLRALSNALQRDGVRFKTAVVSFGQPGAPVFPGVLTEFPGGLLTSITTIDPRIENGYSYQASLEVERQLSGTTSLSAGYIHLRGLHLIMSRNVNAPTLSPADAARLGVSNLGRPDPRFANNSRFESAGDSYYDAMTFSLNKRPSKRLALRASYTFSKAIDTAGNFFFSSPQNNLDIRDDRGLSDNDQRHRLAVSGSFEQLPGGFVLSYIYAYESALPFNVQTGTDRNFDTSVNDRPVGVGRNTGRGFNFSSLDFRLDKIVRLSEHARLELIVESFNTFNRSNLQLPNRVFGAGITPLGSFGAPTGAADPRQIQLGLRFSF